MSSHTEKELVDYLLNAIDNDYLINLLITSHTQGKRKSANMPFGLGKTTLEFWLNYYLNGKNWDRVFETTKYNPYEFFTLFDPTVRQKEGRLEYLEEGEFPKLPQDVENRYRNWRIQEKAKMYPNLLSELSIYSKLRECNAADIDAVGGIVTLSANVVKPRKGQYGIMLPAELGEKLYNHEVTIALSKK